MIKKISLSCWIFWLFVGSVYGQDVKEPVKEINIVLFEGGYPPFYMSNMQEGMIIDFFNAFAQQSSTYSFKFIPLSRKRIDIAMESGSAQVSGLTNPVFIDPEQVDNYVFTHPIWKTGNYIIMHRDRAFHYAEPQDLFGKTLGVIFGNRNGEIDQYIDEGLINVVALTSNAMLYEALAQGRVDAIIGNEHVAPYEMEQLGMDVDQFVFADQPMYEFELMAQVQKNYQEFAQNLNEFIALEFK